MARPQDVTEESRRPAFTGLVKILDIKQLALFNVLEVTLPRGAKKQVFDHRAVCLGTLGTRFADSIGLSLLWTPQTLTSAGPLDPSGVQMKVFRCTEMISPSWKSSFLCRAPTQETA